jgi:hypothetical protein
MRSQLRSQLQAALGLIVALSACRSDRFDPVGGKCGSPLYEFEIRAMFLTRTSSQADGLLNGETAFTVIRQDISDSPPPSAYYWRQRVFSDTGEASGTTAFVEFLLPRKLSLRDLKECSIWSENGDLIFFGGQSIPIIDPASLSLPIKTAQSAFSASGVEVGCGASGTSWPGGVAIATDTETKTFFRGSREFLRIRGKEYEVAVLDVQLPVGDGVGRTFFSIYEKGFFETQ